MKKIVCLTLALLLCLSAVALAEEVVPSKNTSDMVVVEVDPALNTNVPADSGFVVIPVLENRQFYCRCAARWGSICRFCMSLVKNLSGN